MEKAIAVTTIDVVPTPKNAPYKEPSGAHIHHASAQKKADASMEEVHVVPIKEYKKAALTLAEAFWNDDVARYSIDTPDREHWTEKDKWDLHLEILEYVTYAHCLKGLVTTVGPNYGAVALWMPPGKNMDDTLTIFRSGLWRLNFRLSREGRARFFSEFLPLLHNAKAEILGEQDDHAWYLVYLGARPSSQGRGYGRKLIEQVTKIADEQGRPTYLESSNPRNNAFYERCGFQFRRRVELTGGKPLTDGQGDRRTPGMDCMVRDPQPKNT